MNVAIFCHSIVSDWNHGNAHFLRGVVAELLDRGHDESSLAKILGGNYLRVFERVFGG